jgi:carbonic anhydrase
LTPQEALDVLKSGNARFAAGETIHRNLPESVRATAAGQTPFGAIVSCMDSRVPVELVFDLTVGDAFSIRVAGNVINADILGSLEFAAKIAGARLIVVLGHTRCGAIQGAIDGIRLGHLTEILARVRPETAAGEMSAARITERNVRNSMKEIREKSPVLRELLDSGDLHLAGGIYDVETGRATFFEERD